MSARCYTIARLLQPDMFDMARRTFFTLKKAGKIPCLEELKPRLGRRIRYRAEPIDRYFDNLHGRSRFLNAHRRAS